MGHTAMHTNVENDLDALTQKVGINGDSNTSTLDYKVTHNTTNISSLQNQLNGTNAAGTLKNPIITISALGAAAGSPGRVKISETILSSSAASVTFSSIPQVYRSLVLVWMARGDGSSEVGLLMQANGDSATNYEFEEIFANTTGTPTSTYFPSEPGFVIGDITATTSTANYFNMGTAVLPFYAQTVAQKLCFGTYIRRHMSSAGNFYNQTRFSAWKNTAAITSLKVLPDTSVNFISGSSFVLYGEP